MNTFVIAGPNTITTTVGLQIGGTPTIGTGNPVTWQTQCNTDTFSVTGPGGSVPPVICGTNTGQHGELFYCKNIKSFTTLICIYSPNLYDQYLFIYDLVRLLYFGFYCLL